MAETTTFKNEYDRLYQLYQNLPQNKLQLASGLIAEAARLRVLLSELWDDLQENGTTELFSQSAKNPPYQRERPQARLYISSQKNYATIIKQLTALLPPEERAQASIETRLNALMEGAEHEH